MKKYSNIAFEAKIKPIKPINEEFTLVKVYVQGIGKNRNSTYMSKENVEAALPTLSYCPVVGHLIEVTDDNGEKHRFFGGHDWTFNEDWEIVDLTVPYGVVVEDSFDFEIVTEYGVEVEYLTANAILWTGRYPELYDAIYSEDIWFNQSMEINIAQGKYRPLEEDSNYTELLEWSYSALCILGKADKDSTNGHTDEREHTEPCFISSRIIPVEFSKSEFTELMNEMKEKISFCMNQSSTTEVDIDENTNGGSTMHNFEENEVVEETVEEILVEDESEETTELISDDVDGATPETTEEEFEQEEVVDETAEFETVDETAEEVADEATETEVVEESPDETEVDFSSLYSELKEKYDVLEEEFSVYKAEHSFLNSEYEALKDYHDQKESEIRNQKETEIFAKYSSKIGDAPEFKELQAKAADYSLAELEKECLCLVGMYSMTNETSKPESLRFSITEKDSEDLDDEPYGGLIRHYIKK